MVDKIEKLTPEQEKLLIQVRDEWIAYGRSTEPANHTEAERALCDAFVAAGKPPPTDFYWVDSPRAGYIAAGMIGLEGTGDPEVDIKRVKDDMHFPWLYGHQDAWYSYHDAFHRLGLEAENKLEPMFRLARYSGWCWSYWKVAIFSEKPTKVMVDEQGRLHCDDGPAVEYRDGFRTWCVHGVRLGSIAKSERIMARQFTHEDIDKEQNSEVRRVMIDRYGAARYIQDSGAKLIHEDERGKLYRKEIQGDEPICMVRVINSTPEPDGTKKEYWLRVNPECSTATEAVASTFVIPDWLKPYYGYKPQKET